MILTTINFDFTDATTEIPLNFTTEIPHNPNRSNVFDILCFTLMFSLLIGTVLIYRLVKCCYKLYVNEFYLGFLKVYKLPQIAYHEETDNFGRSCTLCLKEYTEGELIRILPCEDSFHTKCLQKNMRKFRSERCPRCLESMFPTESEKLQEKSSNPLSFSKGSRKSLYGSTEVY